MHKVVFNYLKENKLFNDIGQIKRISTRTSSTVIVKNVEQAKETAELKASQAKEEANRTSEQSSTTYTPRTPVAEAEIDARSDEGSAPTIRKQQGKGSECTR